MRLALVRIAFVQATGRPICLEYGCTWKQEDALVKGSLAVCLLYALRGENGLSSCYHATPDG